MGSPPSSLAANGSSQRPNWNQASQSSPRIPRILMPDHQLRLTAGDVTCLATLRSNATAQAIWDALPLEGRANRWGDEIYFAIPVQLDEEDAREEVQVGDLAYWPPGHALL